MPTTIFCIPVRASTLKELQKKVKEAELQADIIEIWLDCLPFSLEPAELKELTQKPLLLVCKTRAEGGKWQGNEQEKIDLLKKYLQYSPAYLDVDINTAPEFLKELCTLKKRKSTLIFSYHHFFKTPSLKFLKKIVEKGFRLGADIVKIATLAQKVEDNSIILSLLQQTREPLIAHCMGSKGITSRLLAPRFGSGIVYVALNRKSKTAPGQMTKKEYQKLTAKYLNEGAFKIK